MRNKITLEFKVGVFVILAMAVLVMAVFYKGRITTGRGYDLVVQFGYVGGLGKGAPVMVSGLRVGEVRQLDIVIEGVKPIVQVHARIQPQVRISRKSEASIRTLGMIGEKYVEITPAHDEDYLKAGQTLVGVDPLPLERLLASSETIVKNLDGILASVNKMVSDKSVQENVRNVLKNADLSLASLNNLLDRVTKLAVSLEETNTEAHGLLTAAAPRVEGVLGKTEKFLDGGTAFVAHLDEHVGTLAGEFSGTGEELKKTSAEVRTFVSDLRTKGVVAQMMKDEDLLKQVKEELVAFQETTQVVKEGAGKFGKLCDDVNGMVVGVRGGQGAVGMLMTDKALYDKALKTMTSLSALVEDVRNNPWKILFSRPPKDAK